MQLFFRIVSILPLLFLFATSSIYSKPSFKIEPLADKSFVLHLELKELVDVTVKLKDKKGIVLVEEEINDTLSFSKKYNLNPLPSGNYTLVIEDHISICKLPLALAKNQLYIDADNQKEIVKPVFLPRRNSVDVVLLLSEKTDTEMYIYDAAGNTIYSKKAKYSENIRRRFDMTKLKSGRYSICVIAGGAIAREMYTVMNGSVRL